MSASICDTCKVSRGNRCMILRPEGVNEYRRSDYCPFKKVLGLEVSAEETARKKNWYE